MGPHHVERIEALGGIGRTHLLSSYASRGRSDRSITDPFGGDLDDYRAAFDELDREVQQAIERIATERTPGRS
jgi:protein-tyrosine-phosphatase